MKTLFVVCQHGDEKLPYQVVRRYGEKVKYLLANKKAYLKNVRYVETDLNRSFPGNVRGSDEEKLAARLKNTLRTYDIVVDLHTATCSTPLFAIITKISPGHVEVIKKLGVKKVVYMGESIASGRALIDHVRCGISVECGNEKSKKTRRDLEKMMEHYCNGYISEELEYFRVYKLLKPSLRLLKLPNHVKNFKKTELEGEEFYPVLARERNYKGILCLMAKKAGFIEVGRQ